MKKFINKLYNHQGGQLLISVFMAVLCFAILYLTHDVYWAMVDDNETMKIVSGYMTGEPVFCGPFINVFLGYFFTFLYGITTAVSWYTVFHIFIVFVSVVAIFRLTLLIFRKKNVSILVPVVLCVTLFFITFTSITLHLLFTYSALTIGCASIALLLIADLNSEKKIKYLDYSLSALCLILSFVIRYQSGQAMACFWGLTLAYIVIKNFIKKRKILVPKLIKTICLVFVVLSIVSVLNFSSIKLKQNYDTNNFYLYNSYRSKYLDYTSASWYTNREFYESIGWTKNFFHISKSWYFMDERFNLESLQEINKETIDSGYGLSFKENVYLAYDSVINDKTGLSYTVTLICLIAANLLFFVLSKDKRKNLIHFLYAVCAVGGMLVLSIYLCIQGRFLIHIYQTVALPTIVILFASLAMLWKNNKIKSIANKYIQNGHIVVCSILSILLITAVTFSIYDTYIEKQPKLKKITEYHADLNEYALINPDNLYIYNQGDVSAFLTYDKEKYTPNTILWGGCLYNSRNYYDFLSLHGYEHFYSENFYDEGVYLATTSDYPIDTFRDYLIETNGKTEFVEVYRTEHLVIYDINKA